MPRYPDVPCRGCGKMLWSGATSLPEGERACQPCRREGKGISKRPSRICACGSRFVAEAKVKTCSRACGFKHRVTPLVRYAKVMTPEEKQAATLVNWQRKNLKRRAGGTVIMTIAQVGDRDGWQCHLCDESVDKDISWPDVRSASRDHLIPVSKGGSNDPGNLKLAHLGCNARRKDRSLTAPLT